MLIPAAVLITRGGLLGAGLPAAEAAPSSDLTSALERRRVDSIPTPELDWYLCTGGGRLQCATVKLPVDYDDPGGPQTEIALVKYPADKPKRRIGTLFVNPGGPGGSGIEYATFAPLAFSPALTDRFDIVGFDPRGTNSSDRVQCFPSPKEQSRAVGNLIRFPLTRKEERITIAAVRALGRGCATTGQPLSASMSTAQVARDLDVLRRAVGDRQLTYFGSSYGTYLGQVYANLFPDRVRALALDGVVDPQAWQGSPATRQTPQWDRIRSADGAAKALRELLRRCDRAGNRCTFSKGNPQATFDRIARRLKAEPLSKVDGLDESYGYADLIEDVLGELYREKGPDTVVELLTLLEPLTASTKASATAASAGPAVTSAQRAVAARRLVALRRELAREAMRSLRPKAGFPYDNEQDAFAAVSCTDSLDPARVADFPAFARAADKRARYFGALFVWNGVECADDAWRAEDEDAYRGPFTRRTRRPLLFVGTTFDPATRLEGATTAAGLAPRSALVTSDNWGHLAYGTSSCVDKAVDRYLLTGRTPARGKRCVGSYQPFTKAADDAGSTTAQRLAVRQLRERQLDR